MNYSEIKVKLLIALRGERSSAELSRQMGYSFNQVRRWEQGLKQMRWDEFCDYCEVLNVPIVKVLNHFHLAGAPADSLEEYGDIRTETVRNLRERNLHLTLEGLAKKLNCHLSVLKRYIKGQTIPDLEFIFAILDLKHNWLANFIAGLLENHAPTSLEKIFDPPELTAFSQAQNPLACAVEGCLSLEAYKSLSVHDDQFIADRVGSNVFEVQMLLKRMSAAGTVTLNSQGKYEITYQTINTSGLPDRKLVSQMLRFWCERSAMRFTEQGSISKPDFKGATTYRVTPASRASVKKINELIIKVNDEILNILESDDGPYEDVRVILLQTFSVEDVPKAEKISSEMPARPEPTPTM